MAGPPAAGEQGLERLARKDFRALLECLGGLYALRDLRGFPTHVVSALPKVVSSDITSFNEVNPPKRRNTLVVAPADAINFPDSRRIFEAHIPEHPLIANYQRTHDGQSYRISDFLTRSQFHRLALYNEFYRRVGVEHQMAIALPAPRPLVVGIALNRRQADFSERDRLCLNLLRPHVIQAYRNAEAVTQMQQKLAVVSEALEKLDRGVVVLTRNGRVRLMTARARQWVAEYFGRPRRPADCLPDALQRWVSHAEALLGGDDVPPAREPLVVERHGKRLVVRLCADPDQKLLLLEEQRTAPEPQALERFGLTRREAEVLAWVAEGKTNEEIGRILGLSSRTVQKHLEHIYPKLGVETRTAAARVLVATT